MKKIILVDFSKVISPIGISKFVSEKLEPYLTIDKNNIRNTYKQHIEKLVVGEYSIFDFLNTIKPYLKKQHSKKDLEEQIYKIPITDKQLLNLLLILKKEYRIYLISDIYKELGYQIKKEFSKYFDKFIFSFEEGKKKSKNQFWEGLKNKVNFNNCILFIDDKQENISLAENFGIPGFLYTSDHKCKKALLKIFYKYYPNIILGAGGAGILYGYLLKKSGKEKFIVLEKENQVFGLMKSYKIGNSYYDLGGHALHDKNDFIKKFLEKEGKTKHYRQPRKAYIDYKNYYIPFPFQLHLKFLDEKERKECFHGFLKSYLNNKGKKAKNFDEFLKLKFGNGIYKCFLRNYNKKIWKTKLNNIGINWTNKILYEDIDTFLYGYLEKNNNNYGTNNDVNYPSKGGYQEYLNNFYYYIKEKILNNVSIISIDTDNKLLFSNKGTFLYDNLISTIPLNKLISVSKLNFNKNIFEYLSLQIVSILVKDINEYKQRIYNKDKDFFFHKCVLNSNSSKFLKEKDEFVFQFESSFKCGKKIEQEKIINNCINYLFKKNFINSRNDIIEIQYKEIKYGYPIQTINMLKNKNKIVNKLKTKNIYTLGRFGNWDYINFDKVILNTINLFHNKGNENIDI